jgi:hypothetical protein
MCSFSDISLCSQLVFPTLQSGTKGNLLYCILTFILQPIFFSMSIAYLKTCLQSKQVLSIMFTLMVGWTDEWLCTLLQFGAGDELRY